MSFLRPRAKALLWSLASLLLAGGCMSAPAFAGQANWKINGQFLETSKEAVATTVGKLSLKWKEGSEGFEVTCEPTYQDSLTGVGKDTRKIIGGKCNVIKPAGEPKVSVFVSFGTGTLTSVEGSFQDIFPTFKAEVVIEGHSAVQIEGKLAGKWNNSTSGVEYPEVPLSESSLKTKGGAEVTVVGSDKLELQTGGKIEVGEEGPYWHVNGSKFASGTRQVKQQLKGVALLKVPGILEVQCRNSISEGATIEGNGTSQGQGKGRVLFSSCTVPVPTGAGGAECAVVGGQIKTNPIKSYLANTATQTGIVEVFEPGQGTVFVTFFLESTPGNKCPFKEVGAAGTVVAEVIPAGVENQEGLLAFPTSAITKVKHEGVEVTLPSLKVVGSVATFSAAYGERLATFPEKFGAF